MTSITVTASKEYNVWVGEDLLAGAGERIASAAGGERAMIVTDDRVNALYGDKLERSLRGAGYDAARFVFPHGEQSKNAATYLALLDALAGANLTRSDVIAALGGGVTGDMAGFAAATYLRGIRFAQIPTTLLAMVDSSIGGKTAVNLAAGKNLAGAFYQPDLVLCDIGTLSTLPEDVFQDGCAEMIKHGVIRSRELFDLLKEPILPRLEDVIARNIAIKRDVVAMDERDAGVRQLLNFGHTIGHGIETHSGYRVTHGKAVAAGMVIASRAAFRMGLCGEDCYRDILAMTERYRFDTSPGVTAEQLIAAAFHDKKRSGGRITLVVPEEIGKCVLKSVGMDELPDFIRLGTR